LGETGADSFSIAVSLTVVHNRRYIVDDVDLQFPHVFAHPHRRLASRLDLLFAVFILIPALQNICHILETLQRFGAISMPEIMLDAFHTPLQTLRFSGISGARWRFRPRYPPPTLLHNADLHGDVEPVKNVFRIWMQILWEHTHCIAAI